MIFSGLQICISITIFLYRKDVNYVYCGVFNKAGFIFLNSNKKLHKGHEKFTQPLL